MWDKGHPQGVMSLHTLNKIKSDGKNRDGLELKSKDLGDAIQLWEEKRVLADPSF